MDTLFAQEVYIRIAEDNSAFLCTIRRGRFYSKTAEFPLNCQVIPEPVDEKTPVPLKRRNSHWASEEQ